MWKTIRKEFGRSQFNFTYDKPQDLAAYSWQRNRMRISGYFIIYRFLAAALFLSILVAYGSTTSSPTYFFIYLTNLGFMFQTFHLIISAFVPIEHLVQQAYKNRDNGVLKWTNLDRFSWFLYNVTNVMSIGISVIYWVALFTPGSGLEAINFLIHGFNSITTIIDAVVSGRPCRLMHFYQPFVVILAYVAFSVIYWVAGGVNSNGDTYIYPVLDWDNLGLTVPFVTIGLFVAIPVVHALFWGLHQLRDYLLRSRTGKVSTSVISNEGQTNPVFELVP